MENIYKFNFDENKVTLQSASSAEQEINSIDDIPEGLLKIVNTEHYLSAFVCPDTTSVYLDETGKFTTNDEIESVLRIIEAMGLQLYKENQTRFDMLKEKVRSVINNDDFWNNIEINAKKK